MPRKRCAQRGLLVTSSLAYFILLIKQKQIIPASAILPYFLNNGPWYTIHLIIKRIIPQVIYEFVSYILNCIKL